MTNANASTHSAGRFALRAPLALALLAAATLSVAPVAAQDPMWLPPGFTSSGIDTGYAAELDFANDPL